MVSTTVQCIIHPFFAEGDHILHHHWVNPMDGAGSDPTARWLWTQGRGRTWKPPEQWAFNQQTWRKRLVLPWKKAGDFNWKEWTWMEEDGGMGFIWFYFGDLTDLTMIYMGIGIVGFTINHWQFHARTGGLGMAMDHYHDGDVSKNDGEHNMAPLHCCSKQEKNRWRILKKKIYIYVTSCFAMFLGARPFFASDYVDVRIFSQRLGFCWMGPSGPGRYLEPGLCTDWNGHGGKALGQRSLWKWRPAALQSAQKICSFARVSVASKNLYIYNYS